VLLTYSNCPSRFLRLDVVSIIIIIIIIIIIKIKMSVLENKTVKGIRGSKRREKRENFIVRNLRGVILLQILMTMI